MRACEEHFEILNPGVVAQLSNQDLVKYEVCNVKKVEFSSIPTGYEVGSDIKSIVLFQDNHSVETSKLA